MLRRPISSVATFSQASQVLPNVHSFFLKNLPIAILHCDVGTAHCLGTAICFRTSVDLLQNLFEGRLLLPLTLLSFLFFSRAASARIFLAPALSREWSSPTFRAEIVHSPSPFIAPVSLLLSCLVVLLFLPSSLAGLAGCCCPPSFWWAALLWLVLQSLPPLVSCCFSTIGGAAFSSVLLYKVKSFFAKIKEPSWNKYW